MRYLVAILPMLLADVVLADDHCGDTLQIRREARDLGMDRMSTGMMNLTQLEVWAVDDGDWRIIITYANGESCVVAEGTNYLEGV